MTRTFTGLCIAAAFAFAATAAGQSPSTTTAGQHASTAAGHEVSVTGCLAKSGDGSYILTSATVEPAGSSSSAATTTTGSATTTAGSATTTAGTTGSSAMPSNSRSAAEHAMPSDSTWTLQGGKDLDKHVGHKVQVTGTATWSSDHSTNGFSSTGAATASTGTTTASATGTTGAEQHSSSSMAGSHPQLDVQSVKMIASSCS